MLGVCVCEREREREKKEKKKREKKTRKKKKKKQQKTTTDRLTDRLQHWLNYHSLPLRRKVPESDARSV